MRKTVGIIGFGNMGSAIAEQLKSDYQICVFDKDKNKIGNLSGVTVAQTNADLIGKVDSIILAVKPQEFGSLLTELKDCISADKLVISIAAGIPTEYIEKYLGVVRVIRAMPNILLKAGMALTCISKGKFATDQDLEFAENLFGYIGEIFTLKEEMINSATAVSGSGPAYVCHYIESGLLKDEVFLSDFIKAAEGVGFNRGEAEFLVNNTFKGTVNFLKKTKISPQELRKQVTSKGGTTEAGIEVLQRGGSLTEAVRAAVNRAKELSRG